MKKVEIVVEKIECLKCGWQWVPRRIPEEVRLCPKCKSTRFDEPKKE